MEGFFMIGIWIAILSGTLMSIQGVWNTQVTKQSGLWVSTGWVQLTAFLVCVAAWFFTGRDSVGTLWQVENKYTLLGGILGTFITVTVIRSMGKLGPAQATMLIVIAQLVVSYLIEMFGLFGVEKQPFEWKKLAGTAIDKERADETEKENSMDAFAGADICRLWYAGQHIETRPTGNRFAGRTAGYGNGIQRGVRDAR